MVDDLSFIRHSTRDSAHTGGRFQVSAWERQMLFPYVSPPLFVLSSCYFLLSMMMQVYIQILLYLNNPSTHTSLQQWSTIYHTDKYLLLQYWVNAASCLMLLSPPIPLLLGEDGIEVIQTIDKREGMRQEGKSIHPSLCLAQTGLDLSAQNKDICVKQSYVQV